MRWPSIIVVVVAQHSMPGYLHAGQGEHTRRVITITTNMLHSTTAVHSTAQQRHPATPALHGTPSGRWRRSPANAAGSRGLGVHSSEAAAGGARAPRTRSRLRSRSHRKARRCVDAHERGVEQSVVGAAEAVGIKVVCGSGGRGAGAGRRGVSSAFTGGQRQGREECLAWASTCLRGAGGGCAPHRAAHLCVFCACPCVLTSHADHKLRRLGISHLAHQLGNQCLVLAALPTPVPYLHRCAAGRQVNVRCWHQAAGRVTVAGSRHTFRCHAVNPANPSLRDGGGQGTHRKEADWVAAAPRNLGVAARGASAGGAAAPAAAAAVL